MRSGSCWPRVSRSTERVARHRWRRLTAVTVNGEDIVLKSKGDQRYSYCYVADAVSGLIKLLLDGQDGEAYNISEPDDGRTLGGYAEFIAGLAGQNVVYDIRDDASTSKASKALLDIEKIEGIGYQPIYSVEDALKRTYQIYRDVC